MEVSTASSESGLIRLSFSKGFYGLSHREKENEMDSKQALSMDGKQTLGIVEESTRILKQHRKLFFSLASTLTLPLCFLLLAHSLVSASLLDKIGQNRKLIGENPGAFAAERLHQAEVAKEWLSLLGFYISYVLCVLVFFLLSTGATVYSVASIYTKRPVSCTEVLAIVPTVSKRLLITFGWVSMFIATYHAIAIVIGLSLLSINTFLLIIMLGPLGLAFYCVHLYASCIWHLASVISVLEESYGFCALEKSFNLIKGKEMLAFELFNMYLILVTTIGALFHWCVVHHRYEDNGSNAIIFRLLLGVVLVGLLTVVTLFGMIGQTVFYFVCKSFHSEKIDWIALLVRLGVDLGEYVPLKSSGEYVPSKSSIKMESLSMSG